METIYDWLYAHYYQPHAEEVLGAYGDMGAITEEAERLLLAGEGSELERQDAINTLQRLNGTAAFAAGVCFGRRSILDMEFIAPIALGGMTLAV